MSSDSLNHTFIIIILSERLFCVIKICCESFFMSPFVDQFIRRFFCWMSVACWSVQYIVLAHITPPPKLRWIKFPLSGKVKPSFVAHPHFYSGVGAFNPNEDPKAVARYKKTKSIIRASKIRNDVLTELKPLLISWVISAELCSSFR